MPRKTSLLAVLLLLASTASRRSRAAAATFNSPTGALGPRIIRLNLTYWFGSGGSPAGNR